MNPPPTPHSHTLLLKDTFSALYLHTLMYRYTGITAFDNHHTMRGRRCVGVYVCVWGRRGVAVGRWGGGAVGGSGRTDGRRGHQIALITVVSARGGGATQSVSVVST